MNWPPESGAPFFKANKVVLRLFVRRVRAPNVKWVRSQCAQITSVQLCAMHSSKTREHPTKDAKAWQILVMEREGRWSEVMADHGCPWLKCERKMDGMEDRYFYMSPPQLRPQARRERGSACTLKGTVPALLERLWPASSGRGR